jgi:hypothetical protein
MSPHSITTPLPTQNCETPAFQRWSLHKPRGNHRVGGDLIERLPQVLPATLAAQARFRPVTVEAVADDHKAYYPRCHAAADAA